MSVPADQFTQWSACIASHYSEPVKAVNGLDAGEYCCGGAMVLAALDCGILTAQDVANVLLYPESRGHIPELEYIRDAVHFPTECRLARCLRLLNPALSVRRSQDFAREIIYANDKEHFGDALALIKAALTEEPLEENLILDIGRVIGYSLWELMTQPPPKRTRQC